MIAIVNMGSKDDPELTDPMGIRDYEVRINSKVICRFQHKRSDGLAVCLLKASQAVEKAKAKKVFDALVENEINLS